MSTVVNKPFWKEFIASYKDLPELWKVKSDIYKNRAMKTAAYEKLTKKLKEVEPLADREMVKRKINALRSGYRRELKKLNDIRYCKHSLERRQIFESNLWYFSDLDFLRDQESQESGNLIGDGTMVDHFLLQETENESTDSNLQQSRPSNHPYEDLIQVKPDPLEFEEQETEYTTDIYPSMSPSTSTQQVYRTKDSLQKKRKHTTSENDTVEEDDGNPGSSFIHSNTTQNMVHEQSKKHQAFLNFISEELERITDEDILEDVKWNIQTCLHNGIKAQRQKFNFT